MLKKVVLLASLLAAASAMGAGRFGFHPLKEVEQAPRAYIAPENQFIFRLVFPDGSMRQFERDYSRPGRLLSADGWSAKFKQGGKIAVFAPGPSNKFARLDFEKGRLVAFTYRGKKSEFPYEGVRRPPAGVSPLRVSEAAEIEAAINYSRNEFIHKWDGTGRLSFPFINPNHAGVLWAELAFLSLGLLAFRRRWSLALGLAGFAGGSVLLALTGSRGAWLGYAIGLLPFAVLQGKRLARSRLFWGGVVVCLIAVGAWLACGAWGNVMRGFTAGGGVTWSNGIRLEMLRAAPTMMVAAPDGWGFCGAGTAYIDWYQPLGEFFLVNTLINDHLTQLVSYGWFGRYLYLLAALTVLAGLVLTIVQRRNAVPFAVWSSFAVAATFNPIFTKSPLWIAPVATLLYVMARGVDWRKRWTWGICAVACCILAGVALAGFYCAGSGNGYKPLIHAEGRRVCVNGLKPRIWVVDDGALGGGLVGKDIREFYSTIPEAPSIGFVRSVADLPTEGVERLVLSRRAGTEWLMRLSEVAEARKNLPKSVLFFSPPFLPSEIPEGVLKTCRTRVVIGEFAALYDEEYGKAPDWVRIVPGMESYILRWMQYVMEP